MTEIARVLRSSGLLLARFNSVRDHNYGAKPNTKTASAVVAGVGKQFFNNERLELLLQENWNIESIREYGTNCFGPRKEVVEISASPSSTAESE